MGGLKKTKADGHTLRKPSKKQPREVLTKQVATNVGNSGRHSSSKIPPPKAPVQATHNHLGHQTQSTQPRRARAKYNRDGSTLPSEKRTSVQQLRKNAQQTNMRGHNNRTMAAPTNTVRREAFRQRCPCATGPVVAVHYIEVVWDLESA